MTGQQTFIAPGQRFVRQLLGGADAYRFTVLHVGRDALGEFWVTYRDQDGDELAEPAVWIEDAVTAGEIVPVMTGGAVGWC